VGQDDAIGALVELFPHEDPRAIESMVRRSGIDQRFIVTDLAAMFEQPDFTRRNDIYREAAVDLAERAATEALERAGVAAADIDVVIDVSCTGISLPAVDVMLSPRIGLRSDVMRIPIAEAGCAAGALGLNLASRLAANGQNVLLVAVELCSLTFVGEDLSRTNLVASVIFGDGAGAAIVTPDGAGPRFRASHSHLIENTAELMGFDIGTQGLRIVLDKELPALMGAHLPDVIRAFLSMHELTPHDLGLHLVHPGGRSILDTYQTRFELDPNELRFSRAVLASVGNLSSAAILAVLQRALGEERPSDAKRDALVVAIGPGLSFELSLLEF